MPTVEGTMPRRSGDVPMLPCIWCGNPTDVRMIPGAMPELGPQPLHMFCTVALIRAYERWRDGMVLTDGQQAGMRRFAAARQRQLTG